MTMLVTSKTIKQQVVISAIVLIVTLIILGLLFGEKTAPAPLPSTKPVAGAEFITVRQETLAIPLQVRGIIEPEKQLSLTSPVTGTVTHISKQFTAGGSFSKGDVLLQADTAYLNLELQKARSAYAQAVLHEQETRAQIEAGIMTGNPENASELARGKPRLDVATGARETALAAMNLAEKQILNATIRAPFNGRVMTRNIQEQEQLLVGRPLAQIYSTDAYLIRFPLTQEQFSLIEIPAKDTANANTLLISNELTGQQWRGVILRSEGYIAANRMIYMIAKVLAGKNSLNEVVPGSLLKIDLHSKPLTNMIALPASALDANSTAWIITADNRLQRRSLSVLHRGIEYVYITAGLDDNDRVLARPISGISEGIQVNPFPVKTTTSVTTPDQH